jgi:hypothetical protein
LGLIISDAAYSNIAPPKSEAPTFWVTPNAPGRAPATTDGTASQLSAARHGWEEDVQTFRTCTSVQQALKKQIIGVFEPMYLEILNGNMVGYVNISARNMLDHFFETYGNITTVDLEINCEHMRRAWDPQHPVETLFKQIQDCADYSEAGGTPIGTSQQINVGYANNLCKRAINERLSPLGRETSRWKNLDSLQISLRSRSPSAQADERVNRCPHRITLSQRRHDPN